jgi:hypothetical protein
LSRVDGRLWRRCYRAAEALEPGILAPAHPTTDCRMAVTSTARGLSRQ